MNEEINEGSKFDSNSSKVDLSNISPNKPKGGLSNGKLILAISAPFILIILIVFGAWFLMGNSLEPVAPINETDEGNQTGDVDTTLIEDIFDAITGSGSSSSSSGGGGSSSSSSSGGGGDPTPTPSCSDATGCSSAGSFCSGDTPYTCTEGSDGCLDRVNKAACVGDLDCSAGSCVDLKRVCLILDEPNTENVLTEDQKCVIIKVNNITLDCNGFKIFNDGTLWGMSIAYSNNTEIKNCEISNATYGISTWRSDNLVLSNINASLNAGKGISLSESNNALLRDITTSSNSDSGVYLENSQDNILSNVNASSNLYGIYCDSSNNNILSNVNASSNSDSGVYLNSYCNDNSFVSVEANYHNYYGFYLSNSKNNSFVGVEAVGNGYGAILQNSENNILKDSLFCDNDELNLSCNLDPFVFSNNTCEGTCGTVPCDYACDGTPSCSDTCSSLGYECGTQTVCGEEVGCGSCGGEKTCSISGLCEATPVEPTCLVLNEPDSINFLDKDEQCVIIEANNVSLDCNGFTISNDGTIDGVYSEYNYTTIKNCEIFNTDYGVYLYNNRNNVLSNVNASYNNESGIYLDYADNNTLDNVSSSYNEFGVHMHYSDGNNLTGLSSNQNLASGIYLDYADKNHFVSLISSSNHREGVHVFYSDYNKLINASATKNWINGVYVFHSFGNSLTDLSTSFNEQKGVYLNFVSTNNFLINLNSSNNVGEGLYLGDMSGGNYVGNSTICFNSPTNLRCDDAPASFSNNICDGTCDYLECKYSCSSQEAQIVSTSSTPWYVQTFNFIVGLFRPEMLPKSQDLVLNETE